VRTQSRFADKVPQAGRLAQSARAMDQLSHRARLTARSTGRKLRGLHRSLTIGRGPCLHVNNVSSANQYLLIDISNSFTKLAFASRSKIGRSKRVATKRLNASYLRRLVGRRKLDALVVSSVVPKINREIKAGSNGINILWLSSKLELGIGIDYPRPNSIGADRLANAAAVIALYGAPAIVVDFGTAVTFDIVSERKSYLGGVIAPGLEAMTNFLYQRTALLPRISLREPRRAIGKSTIEAMRAGAIFGYRGLVREILARIKRERFRGRQIHVIATGGYAELIAARLPEIDNVRPNLTLEGLRIVANLNC
jgi:type III pantothenate kinase